MKRITYVGTTVLTGDEFGTIVLEYAAALARNGMSETLVFHGINETDLAEHEVSFIIGPASEIVVERISDDTPEAHPDNSDVLGRMRERIAGLKQEEAGKSPPVVHPEPAAPEQKLVEGLDI